MKTYFLAPVMLLALGASAPSAISDPVTRQLVALNAQLQVATRDYDVATLSRLTTSDYTLTSAGAKVYDRAAFLLDAADRSIAYEVVDPEEVEVHHYNNDSAIVTAILHIRYRVGGVGKDVRLRYTDTWVKQGGQWRLASGQATTIKAATPPPTAAPGA